MANILLDPRKILVYEALCYIAEENGKSKEFTDTLWTGLLQNESLYEEFLYYVDNNALKDEFSYRGYSLTDIYVYMLGRYNRLVKDYSKDGTVGNKNLLVLESFMGMLELMKDPDNYIQKLQAGENMDRM